jgi:PAS domain S-box-containing protein
MPTLAAAEERWRLTIDNAPVGIALVSLTGRFVRANEALCQMLGYDADQLAQLTFGDITHPEDLEADLEQVKRLLDGEITSYRMRKRYLHAEGHLVWGDLSVALVHNDAGEPLHFVSHVADLTEEMKAHDEIARINRALTAQKDQLERSNADLEAFAMLASHDLQAPLTTIRGYLELLQLHYGDSLDERGEDWVRRSVHAAERMSELVTSLLEFSRAGSVAPADREAVSVSALVEELLTDLDQLISTSGAVVEVAADVPMVCAERARLRQVLQNLVQNAVKYRSPDRVPHVVIHVVAEESDWLVSVTDNAVGIPAEHREAVFSMGAQVDSADTGHGIGLAACRRIVEHHGGQIWVEDAPDGPGSRFCFTLPR